MHRILCCGLLALLPLGAAERINHAGRILGPQPVVTAPILFNTAAADAVVSAMQIMPRDSAWNEDISARPVAANSDQMIATIRNDVFAGNRPERRRLVVFKEMNYVLIPDAQAKVDIDFIDYADESDDLKTPTGTVGSWPIPANLPIETWPSEQPGLTVQQWQRDVNGDGGDRHAIMVMPGSGWIWESWQTSLTTGVPAWIASNGAKFPLTTNVQRPLGWTSGDAAGLPMFPALVRYDEVNRGMIEHALRIVVKRSRRSYIYPASHQAGSTTAVDVPAMGQRLRLKSSFVIPASWTAQERTLASALKTYGALVADNGGFFSISICPDDRWPAGCFDHLSADPDLALADVCDISNFEVVEPTPANGGPRSAGAPTAVAGEDQTVSLATGATLVGTASGTGISTRWLLYPYAPAPGSVIFANPASLATSASFSATGTYILMFKVSDGLHAPVWDAVVVTVQTGSGNAAPTVAVPVQAHPGTVVMP